MLEIAFPNQDGETAGGLARALRASLLRAGVADTQLKLGKERGDTMDLGTLLQFEWGSALHGTHLALTTIAVAKALWEVCAPARAGVLIKTRGHTIELKA